MSYFKAERESFVIDRVRTITGGVDSNPYTFSVSGPKISSTPSVTAMRSAADDSRASDHERILSRAQDLPPGITKHMLNRVYEQFRTRDGDQNPETLYRASIKDLQTTFDRFAGSDGDASTFSVKDLEAAQNAQGFNFNAVRVIEDIMLSPTKYGSGGAVISTSYLDWGVVDEVDDAAANITNQLWEGVNGNRGIADFTAEEKRALHRSWREASRAGGGPVIAFGITTDTSFAYSKGNMVMNIEALGSNLTGVGSDGVQ